MSTWTVLIVTISWINTINAQQTGCPSVDCTTCTEYPTTDPTRYPTQSPLGQILPLVPTWEPTEDPTSDPTSYPTSSPLPPRYIFVNIEKSFWDAHAYCQTEYGTNLAIIYDQASNDEAYNICITNNCFIGLYDAWSEGTLIWWDGSALTYSNWANNEPANTDARDCVRFKDENGWKMLKCGNTFPFLCDNPAAVPNSLLLGKSDYIKRIGYNEEKDGLKVVDKDNNDNLNMELLIQRMVLIFIGIVVSLLIIICYQCHVIKNLRARKSIEIKEYDVVDQDSDC